VGQDKAFSQMRGEQEASWHSAPSETIMVLMLRAEAHGKGAVTLWKHA